MLTSDKQSLTGSTAVLLNNYSPVKFNVDQPTNGPPLPYIVGPNLNDMGLMGLYHPLTGSVPFYYTSDQ